jgi:hypothetical protein
LTAEELEWTINVVTDTAIDADAVVEQIAATRR